MKNEPPLFPFLMLLLIPFLSGMALVYISQVKDNLLLPTKDYECIDAEPTGDDPSIVACTIFLRKGSKAHTQFLELDHVRTVD